MRNRLFRHTIRCLGVMAVLTACLSAGCAQFNVKEKFPLPFKSDSDEPQPPSRVLAVWVDTIRYTQGEAPTRGFGGRLTFYTNGEEEPVKVDGDVVVYAFDEDGRKRSDPRPTRKYIFRADQLESHYSKSKIGHSYSFFIPWDKVGGVRKEISLIVRFQPKLGAPVASEQARQILPGKPKPEDIQTAESPSSDGHAGGVRAASYQSGEIGETHQKPARGRMQTTTISLPSEFGQQTPKAEIGPRYTRSRYRVSEQAKREHLQRRDAATQSQADSRLGESRLPEGQDAQQERGRALSQPRLAEWRFPGRSILPGANDSESN